MSRKLLVLALAGALLALGGCGEDDDSSDSTPAAQTQPTQTVPAQAPPVEAGSDQPQSGNKSGKRKRRATEGKAGGQSGGSSSSSGPPAGGSTPPGSSKPSTSKRKAEAKNLTPAQLRAGRKFFKVNARLACQTFGLEATAKLLRTKSRDPERVAALYAAKFVETAPEYARRPSYDGCLSGFAAATK